MTTTMWVLLANGQASSSPGAAEPRVAVIVWRFKTEPTIAAYSSSDGA